MLSLSRMATARRGGDGLQELVADRVTEGVVDVLEAVEIDEQGGHRHIGAAGPGQHLFGAVEDQCAVGQTGQRVVHGLEADLVDQPGVADGDGRLGGQTLQAIGQPRGDGQTLGFDVTLATM